MVWLIEFGQLPRKHFDTVLLKLVAQLAIIINRSDTKLNIATFAWFELYLTVFAYQSKSSEE